MTTELARQARRSALEMCSRSGASQAYLRLGKNKEPLMHAAQPDLSTGASLLVRAGLSTEHVRSSVERFARSAA